MARTILILLTLVIGISLVALVYGQDRQPREAADRNTSTSSRDESFPLPTDTTVSVLEGDSDAFPAPAVLPPSTLEEAVPVIGQPQAATPSEPYYSRDPVETPSLEQPTSQQFVPRPQLENVETVTVRPLSLESEPRPFPPGAIQATIQDGSLAPGQLPAGSSGPATSTRSRIPDILVEAIGPSTIQVGQGHQSRQQPQWPGCPASPASTMDGTGIQPDDLRNGGPGIRERGPASGRLAASRDRGRSDGNLGDETRARGEQVI